MPNISKIELPNNNTYDIVSRSTRGIIRATKESTSTSKKFILTADNITELYDGLMISFRNNATASASGIVFNLNDLGEKTVWNSDRNTVITTEIRANGEYIYIFDYTNDRWVMYSGYYNNNTIGEYAGSCIAGPDPYNMARYSMVMQTQLEPPRYASLVTTSTTASNKTKQSCGFLPNGIVLYQNAGTYAAGSAAGGSSIYHSSYFDLRYSFNISSTTFAAAGASVYIKGTINSQDGLFYLADTWWSDSLPSTNDGYYYIYIGQLYSRYQCTMYTKHPIYYHDGTSIKEYTTEIDSDTWRPIQINGSAIPSDHTLNIAPGDGIIFAQSTGPSGASPTKVEIHGRNLDAASGGTDISCVTTGDKYTWNNKMDNAITGTTALANGDGIIFADNSDSGKLKRSSISFNGSTATKCLTQKGTWEAFTNNTGTVTSVKVGTTSYSPSSGVVSLPAYPTTLPASDTTSTYSSTGTVPVNGTAVASALSSASFTTSQISDFPSKMQGLDWELVIDSNDTISCTPITYTIIREKWIACNEILVVIGIEQSTSYSTTQQFIIPKSEWAHTLSGPGISNSNITASYFYSTSYYGSVCFLLGKDSTTGAGTLRLNKDWTTIKYGSTNTNSWEWNLRVYVR